MSATLLRSSCLCLTKGSTLWTLFWAGVAPGIFWAWLAQGGSLWVTLTPALFSLRMFPLLLFQGVSPVCNLCSWMIALLRAALILGSSSGFPMGLVLVGGWTPYPLPHSLMLHDVVAHSYHLLWQMIQSINVFLSMFHSCRNMMLPSLKMNSSIFTPDLTWMSTWSGAKCPANGGWLKFVNLNCNVEASGGTWSPNVQWFGGMGSSAWGRISGVEGSDGVSVYVESSEAVTPVARDTILSAQIISSSSTW